MTRKMRCLRNLLHPPETKRTFVSEAFSVAIPSMIGFIFFYGYQVVDMYWIAKLELGAPTAVALASFLYLTLMSVNEIIGISSIALFSQAFGAGDRPRTGRLIFQALLLKTVIGVFLAGLFVLIINRFHFFYTSDPLVVDHLRAYGNLLSLAIVVTMPYATVLTALRTIGRADQALKAVFVGFLFHIAVDPLLIFGIGPFPELGVKGSALAGVLTQCLGLIFSLFLIQKSKTGIEVFSWRNIAWDWRSYKKFIWIGVPAGGVMLLWNLEGNFVASLAARFGAAVGDGFGIGARIMGFFFMINLGLSMGASVMTGQYIGSNQMPEIRRHMVRYVVSTVLIVGVFSFFLFIFSENILSFFTGQEEIRRAGGTYLRFLAFIIILQCANLSLSAVFEGAGKNLPVFLATGAVVLCFEFPFLAVAYFSLKLGVVFVWIGVLAAQFLYLFILSCLFKTRLWEHKVI